MKKNNIDKDNVWYIKFVTSNALEVKIFEVQVGEKNTITENDNNVFITLTKVRFDNLINSLIDQKVFLWKDYYENLIDEQDECWKLKIGFYDGNSIVKKGKNAYPDNYKNVLSILKKYGISIRRKIDKVNINVYSDEIDKLFDKNMIVRGINYFNKGVIDNLICNKNYYYSTLKNIDNYHIKIELDGNNNIKNMSCDCPYEGNCKHEYAVLLKIKEENYRQQINNLEKNNCSYSELGDSLDEIITKLKQVNKVNWKKLKLSEEYKQELTDNGFNLDSVNVPQIPDYPKDVIDLFVILNKSNFFDKNYLFNMSNIQNDRINDMNLDSIRTFLTYLYKQENSSVGLIARYLENGKLVQLLERLKELI